MRIVRGRRLVALVLAAALVAVLVTALTRLTHGLSFVVRAADLHGWLRHAADFTAAPVQESMVEIPVGSGRTVRARLFKPQVSRRAALVVSGLHPAGIDEPRLAALSRQLSSSGVTVVTPDIPELSRFEITPAITASIERAALWVADQSTLAPDQHVGMMGISFSGGLSIVAAGRPSLAGRVAYVFAFGGHDDLPRVLRYLCTGVDGSITRPPHDYGVAVILLGIADRVVPPEQVETLRAAVRRFLWASHLDRIDKEQALREFAALRALAPTLPEPSATLLKFVNERDVTHLGPRLLPFVGEYGGDPALSASKSPKPAAPVFLLHGADDNVIPSVESEFLAAELRGRTPVRLLISPLISHAEADQPATVSGTMALASFWGDLLSR
jgi:dienelactone hydrolase